MVIPPILAAKLAARSTPESRRMPAQFPMEPFTGPVFSFPDGDGLWVSLNGRIIEVRLHGIDAPEWGQYYARQSWLFLQSMVFAKPVTVYPVSRCVYGRLVGDVYGVTKHSISLMMVLHGYAWYYRPYALHATELRDAQRLARINRRGLWARPNPLPPWMWRHYPHLRRVTDDD